MAMSATISLQSVTAVSGYFNVNIEVVNTGSSPLIGLRLRPVYLTLPNMSVIANPQFASPSSPSYDPLVVASMTLPTIAPATSYVQKCLLPVNCAIYQGDSPHIFQYLVVEEGVAVISNVLPVTISPIDNFADAITSSLHNNTETLSYRAIVSNTAYAYAYTSMLDSVNITTPGVLQIVSTSTADTQMYRLLGLDNNGNVLVERGLLTGTTVLNSRSSFSYLYDFYLSAAAKGNVTVSQGANTYATVLSTFTREAGFRFAHSCPSFINSIILGTSNITLYTKLTAQGFGPGADTVEYPIYQNTVSGNIFFYPPTYIAPNSIVRGYVQVDAGNLVNMYGMLSTAPLLGY